ncbi:hypothetical protein DPMN_055109 [Dreissena polymorpha]|uniref:Uncharacterized protein n=1 Tax=Dreissena polymorpha TaxID=45954 RepID=A0A9D4HS80_DREPO|nr:hypothetical protein DPMN_055109 [Dreissena polymorpha]
MVCKYKSIYNKYVNSKRKTKDTIGALTKPDDSEAETNEDKADVLNTFLAVYLWKQRLKQMNT